jgi:pimeloyl-ACP methyl ester carboxylesterase
MTRLLLRAVLLALATSPALSPAQAPAAQPPIEGHSMFAQRDGLRIHLWQKCLPGQETAAAKAGKVAVLVHGATWSGRPDFDLQIRDYSLMDALARAGYDVFAIDVHGYGLSDKTDKDWSDTASAALDLDAAVEHVCTLRKVEQVRLLGWSWGSLIAGVYASAHPQRVARLILYGTAWHGRARKDAPVPDTQYRTNTAEGARSDFIEGQYEPDVVDAYVKAALAADPRSPNGTLVDWITKMPLLDPEKITVPTLVLRPDKDFAATPQDLLAFFARLQTADKTYVALPDSGHAAILEKGHRRFQQVVLAFFDRP